MNYRRALRISTDGGLSIFVIMIAGVVLWTADELLDWNILPDWIDKYAQLIVIVFAILGGFAVVISLMCSFAVLAEAAAEKAGISSPAPSPRGQKLVAGGIVLALLIMFGLHLLDQYRAGKRKAESEQQQRVNYAEAQKELENQIPKIVALFSPKITRELTGPTTELNAEGKARLLNAIHASTPFNPEVHVMIHAGPPYKYSIISALREPRSSAQNDAERFLNRQFLTDLPTAWEREAIAAMFSGQRPAIPPESAGIFIDNRKPSAWGQILLENRTVAIIMLRGD